MTTEEMIKVVEENVQRLENNEFFLYFFVLDTKGNPSSALEYIYTTALQLKNAGYNVKMLHNEKEFVGVGEWLGEEYANLPHANVEKENVEITASDFLFIPEIFANVMMQTKKLPCKRVILVQNANNITEFMPVSQNLDNLGITDAIVTTEANEDKLVSYFPEVRTHLVSPSIKSVFHRQEEPKNPVYKFVSFRDLRGLTMETFADALREAAITVWVDDKTPFGYTLLESLKSGSIVLAKVPEDPSEWMLDEDGNLSNSIIWFDKLDDVSDMLSSVVRSWTRFEVPDSIYEEQKKFDNLYTEDVQKNAILHVYKNEFIDRRLNDFKEVLAELKNKEEETE